MMVIYVLKRDMFIMLIRLSDHDVLGVQSHAKRIVVGVDFIIYFHSQRMLEVLSMILNHQELGGTFDL